MGMLFNTEHTTRMVALVNRHFGAEVRDGGFEDWRSDRIGWVKPGNKSLLQSATDASVMPDTSLDYGDRAKKRWRKWLNQLGKEMIYPLAEGKPPNGKWGGNYIAPVSAVKSTVDQEICRQLYNVMDDGNCIETSFVVQPAASIGLGASSFYQPKKRLKADDYIYVITITTVHIGDI